MSEIRTTDKRSLSRPSFSQLGLLGLSDADFDSGADADSDSDISEISEDE